MRPISGSCAFINSRVGPHPDDSSLVLVDTMYRSTSVQQTHYTCGPTYAVRPDRVDALRAMLAQHAVVECHGNVEIGSCNPCPVAIVSVTLPAFDGAPLAPVDWRLVRF